MSLNDPAHVDQILAAARTLFAAAKKDRRDVAAPTPGLAAALGTIALPTGDAIAQGPRSPFTDAEIEAVAAELEAETASAEAKVGLARKALGLFGLLG